MTSRGGWVVWLFALAGASVSSWPVSVGHMPCPATRFVAPCECRDKSFMTSLKTSPPSWRQLLCRHITDIHVLQQVLFSNFMDVVVPRLRIEESSMPVLINNAFFGARIRHVEVINSGVERIEDGAFMGLEESLEILILRSNRLTEIPTKSLARLRNMKTLSLSSNLITEVRNDSFAGLTELSYVVLSFNKIHMIQPGSFSNLATLSLSFNRLTSLQGVFRNMPKLRWLFVSGNRLTSLKNEFNYLPELLILLASENMIESLDSDLEPLYNLKVLHLAANKLERIEAGIFNNFPVLEHLNLSGNQISDIQVSSFDKLTSLETLILTDNKISTVFSIFKPLMALRILNLSRNQISALGKGDLVKTLMEVDLSHNLLSRLDRNSFDKLGTTLVKLALNNNRISSMERALNHLEMARIINLEHNNLTTLNTEDLPCSCNSRLAFLKLKGNPLKCDLHLKQVLSELREIKTLSIGGVLECDQTKFEEPVVIMTPEKMIKDEEMKPEVEQTAADIVEEQLRVEKVIEEEENKIEAVEGGDLTSNEVMPAEPVAGNYTIDQV